MPSEVGVTNRRQLSVKPGNKDHGPEETGPLQAQEYSGNVTPTWTKELALLDLWFLGLCSCPEDPYMQWADGL